MVITHQGERERIARDLRCMDDEERQDFERRVRLYGDLAREAASGESRALTDEEIASSEYRLLQPVDPARLLAFAFAPCDPALRVCFGSRRKVGGAFPRYLAHLSAKEVVRGDEKLARILAYKRVEHTQYVTWNLLGTNEEWPSLSFFDLGRPARVTKFPVQDRFVRQLRALWVDLDVGRPEEEAEAKKIPMAKLDAETAASFVRMRIRRDGLVPPPSAYGYSGRGVYMVWFIDPVRTQEKERADSALTLWRSAERNLLYWTGSLNADRNAVRPMNWLKAPGGFDTKTGRDVVYMMDGPDLTSIPVYDLADIESRTRMPRFPVLPGAKKTPSAASDEKTAPSNNTAARDASTATPRVRIYRMPAEPPAPVATPNGIAKLSEIVPPDCERRCRPWLARTREIAKLAAHRRVSEGARDTFLFHLANAVWALYSASGHGVGDAFRGVLAALQEVNALFAPPLPPQEVQVIAHAKRYKTKKPDLVAALAVTDEEARELGLRALATANVEAEREEAAEAVREYRISQEQETRAAILDALAKGTPEAEVAAAVGKSVRTVRRIKAGAKKRSEPS